MKRVLITGMSGTGKSSVIAALAERGYKAIDTDDNGLSHMISVPEDELTGLDPGQDWVWHEDRIQDILSASDTDVLFLAGCAPNQGRFYPLCDAVILLSAPADVIVTRLTERTTNPYGKRPEEVARTLALKQTIEPLLRAGASHKIDATLPLSQVVERVLATAGKRTDDDVPPSARRLSHGVALPSARPRARGARPSGVSARSPHGRPGRRSGAVRRGCGRRAVSRR